MNKQSTFVKMQLLDEGDLVADSVWSEIEERMQTSLSPAERAMWSRLNGARTPRNSVVVSDATRAIGLIDPDLQSMQFLSLDPKTPANRSVLRRRLRYEQFDVSRWIPIGNSDGTDLLWSIDKRHFAKIYVHENRNEPVPIQATWTDFIGNIYVDLAESAEVERLSESQCRLFFRELMTDELARFFHLICRDENVSEISAAIILHLPKSKLEEVFRLHHSKINTVDPETDKYPVHVAANSGRVDALLVLAELGAKLDVGDESPFYTALNCGSLKFLRTLVRLSGKPTRAEDIDFAAQRLSEEENEYVFH
jgi:hypothetical protein